jgi:predicted component of type VI protein secretion system
MSNRSRNLFLHACGSAGQFGLDVEPAGQAGPVRKAFDLPFALLGRDEQSDLVLDDGQVSRRHAYLQMIGGRLWCTDLGSRTGLRWEDGREGPGWLEAGRYVQVGPYRIRRADVEPAAPPAVADDRNPLESGKRRHTRPGVVLEFLNAPTPQPPYRVTRKITLVGKASLCKVQLASASMAYVHCSLVHTPEGLWAVDLDRRTGISVAGRRVRWTRLDHGDELLVGKLKIRVLYGERSDAPRALPHVPAPTAVAPRNPEETVAGRSVSPLPDLPAAPLPVPLAGVPRPGSGEAARGAALPAKPGAAVPGPVPPAPPEVFAPLQQQMFEQYHQSLMAMFQMFYGMHQEQLGVIRQELDRLHELSHELHAVQAELARDRSAAAPPAEGLRIPAPNGAAETAPHGGLGYSPEGSAAGAPDRSGEPRPGAELSAEEGKVFPGGPSAEGQSLPGAPAGNEDAHEWLAQRLQALQEEQQSRWRKLVNMLLFKPSGPPP